MKAKLILTAMAMPVLFAACTSDELVPMEQTQQSARPTLSKDFKLTAEIEGETDTRYAVSGKDQLKFIFEDGDQYGVGTIDTYDKTNPNNPELWDGVNQSGINYSIGGANAPFEYDAQTGVWTSPIPVSVGHNLFVFPYNEEDNSRAAFSYSLPTVQKISKENLNAAIENKKEGNKAFAAKVLRKNDKTLGVTMRNLFAYPKFSLKFDNALDVTEIDKVVLEQSTPFNVAGGFDHKKVWAAYELEAEAIEGGKTADDYWKTVTTTEELVIGAGEAGAEYTTIKTSDFIIAQFPAGTEPTLDDDGNKCIDVRFMIPGVDTKVGSNKKVYLEGKTLKMHIYTNDGVYTIDNLCDNITFGDNTTNATKKRIFARNTSYTLAVDKIEKGNKNLSPEVVVANTDDWEAYVGEYGDMEDYTNEEPLKVAVVGDFVFEEGLVMPEKAIFRITNDITIGGTEPVGLNNILVDGEVNVPEGATFVPGKGFHADKVINYGTVEFSPAEGYDLGVEVDTDDNDVADYILDGAVDNYGTVTVKAAETRAAANGVSSFTLANKNEAVFNNEAKAIVALTNNGTVSNTGKLTVTGTNEAEATFINEGIVIAGTGAKTSGSFTNKDKAIFKNNTAAASVSCDEAWGSTFINAGYAYITNKSTFDISENSGEIQIENLSQTHTTAQELLVLGNNSGFFSYSPSAGEELDLELDDDSENGFNKLTTLYVTGSLELENADYVTNIQVDLADDADLTLNDETVAAVTVKNGSLTIVSGGVTINTLTIKAGAEVYVNKSNSVYAKNFTVEEDATLYVGGTFRTDKAADDCGEGAIEETVANPTIDFEYATNQGYASNVTEMLNAYETAVNNAIKVYWNKTGYQDEDEWNIDAEHKKVMNLIKTSGFAGAADLREDVVDAYNNWQDAQETNDKNDTFTPEKVSDFTGLCAKTAAQTLFETKSKAYRTAVKATAKAAVTRAITEGTVTVDWKDVIKLQNSGITGYATIGSKIADLKDMWDVYVLYLRSYTNTWIKNYTTGTKVDYTKEEKTLFYAIENIRKDANLHLTETELTAQKKSWSTPDLSIPAGSYLDVTDTSNDYKAIVAWIENGSWKSGSGEAAANLHWYSGTWEVAATDGYDVKRRIQDWFIVAGNTTIVNDMDDQNAKTAGETYKPVVVQWTDAKYSSVNIGALVDLVQVKLNK